MHLLDSSPCNLSESTLASLLGLHVTANLYLPEGKGPFPAIISSPGHGAIGKNGSYQFGGNFARNGIAVLAYDVIGQGERLQYPDASGNSILSQTIDEHAEAGVQTMLLGKHISRYFIWDAMRSLDYLQSRRDIKHDRVGAYGCSGGGTITAYFAALDERVKAAGVGCYLTSEQQLLIATGPQDAEQSIPGFIAAGLDFPDWIELFAPKPYAMISTTTDIFPFAGAKTAYAEAKHFYTTLGASDRLHWFHGPGPHGNLGPMMPDIMAFFLHSLKEVPESAPKPAIMPISAPPKEAMLCTSTGQLASSLGGETIYSLAKREAAELAAGRPTLSPAELRANISELSHVAVSPVTGPSTSFDHVRATTEHGAYSVKVLKIHVENSALPAILSVPATPGPHHVELLLSANPVPEDVQGRAPDVNVILAFGLRPSPRAVEAVKCADSYGWYCTKMNPEYLGPHYLMSQRALLVDKTLLGLRMDDVISVVHGLCQQSFADCSSISAEASGAYGTVLLCSALLDSRIAHLSVDHSLSSYSSVVNTQFHRNVSESILPGALTRFDLPDVAAALGTRLTLTNSVSASGDAVR